MTGAVVWWFNCMAETVLLDVLGDEWLRHSCDGISAGIRNSDT